MTSTEETMRRTATRIATLAAAAAAWALALPAGATGLKVEPGKWETAITMQNPMSPTPTTRTETQCITVSEFSADEFLDDSQDCTVTDLVTKSDRMSFTLNCAAQGGSMTGKADYRTTGTTFEGSMRMTMAFGGRTMAFEQTSKGRRIGPCD